MAVRKIITLLLAIGLLPAGVAQPLEEVVVTAQKREQPAFQVPLAVAVIDVQQSALRGGHELLALSDEVPSLALTQAGSVLATSLYIRGLGTYESNVGLEPSVAVVIDNVYQARPAQITGDLLDAERIEVVKGPQSTLFGKNASAGVVSITTKKPAMDAAYALQLGIGNNNARHRQFSATGPVTSSLAYRVSATQRKQEGIYDASSLNNKNRWAANAQLLFTPNDRSSWRLKFNRDVVDELCCAALPVITAVNGALFEGRSAANVSRVPTYRHKQRQLSLHYQRAGDNVAFESTTAWQRFGLHAAIDGDFTTLDIAGAGSERKDNLAVLSQEWRWMSTQESTFQWQTGLYLYRQNLQHSQPSVYGTDARPYFDAVTGGTSSFSPLLWLETILNVPAYSFFAPGAGVQQANYDAQTRVAAAFGQISMPVTAKLRLNAGVRYTYERKSAASYYVVQAPFSALDLSPDGALASAMPALSALQLLQFYPPQQDTYQQRSNGSLSGHLGVQYIVGEFAATYLSIRRGVKAGGYQLTNFVPDLGTAFDDEIVDAVEWGLKLQAQDHRWQVNTAVFHQWLRDHQVFAIEGNRSVVRNASAAHVSGVELDAAMQFGDRVGLNASVSYLQSVFDSYRQAPCPALNTAQHCDLSMRPLPYVGRWHASIAASWRRPGPHYNLTYAIQLVFDDNHYTAADLDPLSRQGAYTRYNISAQFAPLGRQWSLTAWGRNLGGKHYAALSFDSPVLPGYQYAYSGEPRSAGLTFNLNF